MVSRTIVRQLHLRHREKGANHPSIHSFVSRYPEPTLIARLHALLKPLNPLHHPTRSRTLHSLPINFFYPPLSTTQTWSLPNRPTQPNLLSGPTAARSPGPLYAGQHLRAEVLASPGSFDGDIVVALRVPGCVGGVDIEGPVGAEVVL